MHRRPGLAQLRDQERLRQQRAEVGAKANEQLLVDLRRLAESFRIHLEEFASRHKKEIQDDPHFRSRFHQMCSAVGVDPLMSRKSAWTDLLGGDYYHELAVRIVEVCMRTRNLNGGLLSASELVDRLRRTRRTFSERISVDDVERAVNKLSCLGNGFRVVSLEGNRKLIQSIPDELNPDLTRLLSTVGPSGYIAMRDAVAQLNWDQERAIGAFRRLMEMGLCWIDVFEENTTYWFLGMIQGAANSESEGLPGFY